MAEIYTDTRIKEEVNKILENPLIRRCRQCANRNSDCTRCEQLGIPISQYMYSGHCKFFKTDEEKMLEEARAALAENDKKNKKEDRVLTMSFLCAEMSMVFLEDFEARIKADYERAMQKIEEKYKRLNKRLSLEDEEYVKDQKKEHKRLTAYIESMHGALKQMDKGLKEARKQFTHYVEPKLNKAFFDKEHSVFNGVEYDNHQEDIFEMCEVNMSYFDATYMNDDNSKSIKSHIASCPAERLMDEADYKRYKFKR